MCCSCGSQQLVRSRNVLIWLRDFVIYLGPHKIVYHPSYSALVCVAVCHLLGSFAYLPAELLQKPFIVSLPGRRFTFRLEGGPERVGMATGATIHTANGLRVRVTARAAPAQRPAVPAAGQAAEAPALAAAG